MSNSQARLRTSCDACQSLKIKCSQNKPECHRCVKHGLRCVYSPLRRMGRPRKRTTSSHGAQFSNGDSDVRRPQVEDSAPTAEEDEEDAMGQWPDSITPISLSLAGLMDDAPSVSGANDRLAATAGFPVIASEDNLGDFYQDTFMEEIQTSTNCRVLSISRQLPTAAPSRRNSNELKRNHLGLGSNSWSMTQTTGPTHNTSASYMLNDFLASSDQPEISAEATNGTGNSQSRRRQQGVDEEDRAMTGLQEPYYAGFNPSSASHPPISPSDPFGGSSISANSSWPQNSLSYSLHNDIQSNGQSRRPSLSNATPNNRHGSFSERSNTGLASESDGPCKAQCYLTILRRLAWLEHACATKGSPLTIDLVMTAERDTRLLKEKLFQCGSDAPEDEGCLHSRPSSLIALNLLAECVVSLFEDLFRRAALSAQERERIFRSAWPISGSPMPPGGMRTLSAQQSATRFERSIRGAFDRNITCPIPEANCDLLLGKFRVGSEAKARAIKQILRRRIRKLLATLVDMKGSIGPGGGVLLESAKQMAKDLHHRVESLQGRVELAE